MAWLFIFLKVSFTYHKVLISKSSLLIFFFYGSWFLYLMKSLHNTRAQRFSPIFSSRSFSIWGFIFDSKIHFELIFHQVKNMDCIYLPMYLALILSLSLSLHLHPVCYLDLWILAALTFWSISLCCLLNSERVSLYWGSMLPVSSVWKPSLHIVCLLYLLFKESFYC